MKSLVTLFLFSAAAAIGGQITYTFSATATGTLDSTAFTNAAFTVTAFADTNQVGTTGSINVVAASLAQISIAGLPLATFTDSMFVAADTASWDLFVGNLSRVSSNIYDGAILGITIIFLNYDLRSSFGPVFSAFDFPTGAFNEFQNVPTDRGLLSLNAANETFTATETPEPPSFTICAILLAAAGYSARSAGSRSRVAARHAGRALATAPIPNTSAAALR
jgi:hypothetical protein